jgi:hypothetical protein
MGFTQDPRVLPPLGKRAELPVWCARMNARPTQNGDNLPKGTAAVECPKAQSGFWKGELAEGPLMWVTAPGDKPGRPIAEPASEGELWTNVDYVITAAESALSGTHYAGDALPVFRLWLGPDQFAVWLGAELLLRPRQSTSWSKPFIRDWTHHSELRIKPGNRWWRTYLQIMQESVRAGKGKWVTGYPGPRFNVFKIGGKSVQFYYGEEGHGGDADLTREIDVLTRTLDPARLFLWATVDTAEEAEEITQRE